MQIKYKWNPVFVFNLTMYLTLPFPLQCVICTKENTSTAQIPFGLSINCCIKIRSLKYYFKFMWCCCLLLQNQSWVNTYHIIEDRT